MSGIFLGIFGAREKENEMCQERNVKKVWVKIPADLSSTGKEKWRWMRIDDCIARLVKALQTGGVDMRGSCCGHGGDGDIHLQDGRALIILSKEQADQYYQQKR